MNGYEFEEQLIGSMLIKGDHIDCHEIVGKLPSEAFENHHLREMYKAITKLLTKCEPIDMFSVQYAVPEGTRPMVLDVAARCTSAANIKPWAKRVRQCWMLRKGQKDLMQAASILSEAGPHDINERIAEAVALVNGLTFETNNKLPRKIADILPDYLDVLDKRYDGDKSGLYLQVGIDALDKKYGGFDRTDMIVIAGQPGMGKAMPLDEKILLSDGTWTTHGNVKIGDKLASVDGGQSYVTGVFPQGSRITYRVTFEDGREVKCADSHLWEISSSRFSGARVVDTETIAGMLKTERYQGRICVPSVSGDFGIGESSIDGWVLGALLGDGSLTKSVKFTNSEDYVLSRMARSVSPLNFVSVGENDYIISNRKGEKNQMMEKLLAYGLMGKTAVDKFIPESIFSESKSTRIGVLVGLLETDGWVEKFGCIRFSSASHALVDGVSRLVYSLGGSARKSIRTGISYSYKGEKMAGLDAHMVAIRLPDEIIEKIESPRLRANLGINRLGNRGIGIKSVTAVEAEECLCIMVDHPRHLYVTGDYIVTHNTELAIMMANYIGSQRGNRGLFVSMEMSDVQIVERHIADRSCLPIGKLRNPLTMEEYEKNKMHACIGGLIDQENYVLDATMSVDEIITHAERMVMEDGGLSFLAIDYLGLIKKGKADRNDLAIADITRKLKSFALKNKVPVILLSQLNRKVAERGDKRPIIQDLRDSGSIEQDADVIIFPYREEVHKENTPMKGIAEIIVAKYRSGEPTTVYMQWVNGHFKNMDQAYADNIKRGCEEAARSQQANDQQGWKRGKK